MNEPSRFEIANGKILPMGECLVFFLNRDVYKGEELTFHYGPDYYRDYSVGEDCYDRLYHPKKYIFDIRNNELLEKAHQTILDLLDVADGVSKGSDGEKHHSTVAAQ